MNFSKFAFVLAVVPMAFLCTGCDLGPAPHPYIVCSGGNCTTTYYNGDGSVNTTRDIITDLAQAEQQLLESQARYYGNKFSLNEEQGMKIAKTINDYNAIQNRSDQDVADFAQRLYGVSPSRIAAAVGKAQAGESAELKQVIDEAAKNFDTSSDNMKAIVKTLHGKLLEQQGIVL